ncbi:Conserved_hypothetical protein [Hexamita inflata]|uniref:Uncharacterized protein n=1 Tax=Hexamita inflata TaxID=28002 RepID=A0AA86U786_9EUKA|nr:Conserved hypothetical protein [Hexamita inflata]CAI9940482.1 Conserved hypothetical protein [Hexamita inflata]
MCICNEGLTLVENQCICSSYQSSVIQLDWKTCSSTCPEGQTLVKQGLFQYCTCEEFVSQSNQSCVSTCDPGQITDLVNKRCQLDCVFPLMKTLDGLTCVLECPPGQLQSLNRQSCVSSCSSGVINEFNRCVCPNFGLISLLGNQCVQECNFGEQQILFEQLSICACRRSFVKQNNYCMCKSGFINLDWNSCTESCPASSSEGEAKSGAKLCTCSKFISTDKKQCVDSCVDSLVSLDNARCQERCLPGSADLSNSKCVAQCAENQMKDFGRCFCEQTYLISVDSSTCVNNCNAYVIATDYLAHCVASCPFPKAKQFNDYSTLVPECVDSCPESEFINRADQFCVKKCEYLNESLRICESNADKKNCNLVQVINEQKTCVQKCGAGYIVKNNECVVVEDKKDNKVLIISLSVVFGVVGLVLVSIGVYYIARKNTGYKKVKPAEEADAEADIYV